MPVNPAADTGLRDLGMVASLAATILISWLAVKLDYRRVRKDREWRKREMEALVRDHGEEP